MEKMRAFRRNYLNILIIISSFVLRIYYCLITTVGDRQHDLGYATYLNDGKINPGHLGYVEYIAKFGHLPDFDPFSIFSYYHPPIHHIIAALFVKAAHALGISEPACYEAIQIPTCIYGCLCVLVGYAILRRLTTDSAKLALPLALIAYHPSLIYMCGTVNNDMLATLMIFLCIYTTILWMQTKSLKHLVLMALSIGIGMIVKLNVVVMACPMAVIMLMHLIEEYKSGNLGRCIRQYVLFGCISIPIGLSWSIRNIILFHVKPGISSASPESNQYIGSFPLNEIIGMPVSSSLAFPFHSENASYCHNAWSIMFKTSIFAEIWPENIDKGSLLLCQIAFVVTIILGVLFALMCILRPILMIRRGNRQLGALLLTGFLAVIATYVCFVIKYPYTCSCDFRYIAGILVFDAITLLPLCDEASRHTHEA